jgi:hypothetical protein
MGVFDLKFDTDLVISNGDLVVTESTQQNQLHLMMAAPGEYTQSPTAGVDVYSYLLNESTSQEVKHKIQEQFEADGMTIIGVQIAGSEIKIDATYDDNNA